MPPPPVDRTGSAAPEAPPPSAYPLILINLAQARCVVVGGGAVAERKVRELLAGGARPLLISPDLTAALAAWRDAGLLTQVARAYQDGDLAGAFLVIAATDDRAVNAAAAAAGMRLGALVNVADDPDAGTFHTPAVVRRGDLVLSVSTSGASPSLTAHIRRELEGRYGPEYALLAALLRRLRAGPARALAPALRLRLWQRLISDTVVDQLRAGLADQVEQFAQEQIDLLAAEIGDQ